VVFGAAHLAPPNDPNCWMAAATNSDGVLLTTILFAVAGHRCSTMLVGVWTSVKMRLRCWGAATLIADQCGDGARFGSVDCWTMTGVA